MDVCTEWTAAPPVIPPSPPSLSLSPLPSWMLLCPNFWFDPNTYALINQGQSISLTPREARLLAILLSAPGCYHSSEALARRLRKRGAPPITSHSIAQTIYGLRQKLSENEDALTLLRSRREVGYAIFPHTPLSR